MKDKKDLIQDDGQESQTNGDQAIKETKKPKSEETGGDQRVVPLPDGVTLAPRNVEEMDLDLIKHSSTLVDVYLKVSDDQGELLGDADLEKTVKDVCEQYKDMKEGDIKRPNERLREVKALSIRYATQVNKAESIVDGTITKYRIREGMLFNLQKKLATASGYRWMRWFKQNYDPKHIRSVEDYMRLAKVPNIIRYSVFGKERLLQILRLIGDSKSEDPILEFLQDKGVDFDPQAETDFKELKIQTDIAINHQRLVNEDMEIIPVDRVEAFVRDGKEIQKRHLRELKIVRDTHGDLVEYMDKIIASDGAPEPVMTPDRKAESFKKTVNQFLKATDNALEDSEYLGKIDADFCAQVKQKILDLEQKITSSS